MPKPIEKNIEDNLAIQNIFGKPPGWLVYWGITISFLFLLVCLGISAFVKYPDTLQMPAKLFSKNPPIEIVSKISEEIDSIYISDNQRVHKDEIILKLKSTVKEADLGVFKNFIVEIDKAKIVSDYLKITFPKRLNLGVLSTSYISMMQDYEEFQHFLKQKAIFVKVEALGNEINQMELLDKSLSKQEVFYEKELALTEKDYGRRNTLRDQGVIADVEQEQAESRILGERRNLESFRTQKLNNKIRVEQIQTQISDMYSERSTGISNRVFSIHQIKERILNEIKEWEELHVVKSPFEAKVSYAKYLTKDQFVGSGEVLLTCLPINSGQAFIAHGNLPLRASGNLRVGQKAMINIENFPSTEYGVLNAEVEDFSIVPNEDTYLVMLKLPDPLITTYGKLLPMNQNMSASVTIQTKEFSLLERVFQNIMDVTKNRIE